MWRSDYEKKLSELFDNNSNFEKIENYSIRKDILNLRALVKSTLERSVPKKVLERIGPKHSISSLYGIVKLHRENQPLRPIQTSYDSLASNIDKFLVKLLEPLNEHLIYTVDSEKAFKEKLMSEKHKFRPSTQLALCFLSHANELVEISPLKSLLKIKFLNYYNFIITFNRAVCR